MSRFLAFDGGGTHTRAALYDPRGNLLAETEGGPSNPNLVGLDGSISALVSLGRTLTDSMAGTAQSDLIVAGAVAGMGAGNAGDEAAEALGRALGAERAIIADDIRPILFANARGQDAVVVIAGTGSSIVAQNARGEQAGFGGRGVVFGDDGSGHQLAVSAMRAAAAAMDGLGPATSLTEALPAAAGVADLRALVPWSLRVEPRRIAALAPVVNAQAERGDPVAQRCLDEEAASLADLAWAAWQSLALPPEASIFMHGGVFEGSKRFRAEFEAHLGRSIPGAHTQFPPIRGHRAALALAIAPLEQLRVVPRMHVWLP